ncbi:unnamed protein product [Vitrella brassicaformis CCMP3155]|uniref:Band 7 domain-containing protein n=2 Tax=Vitrella brassicaformis TaxID=1169539 RepID=A0A0G4EAQ4_VITBC|nr:unnamed protein product [Vitrella brassicaformis CCMP3155]|mmetsp:Transcript_35650/g.88689  ORF Transcript_35650/g.88689 Transcript_35650/m.88689 type:complete len:317 (+) Transcript_35650:151-1101(+)|eukprot:CEL92521.1 unnamed protein product [Vitrella brassicaformis CCMP3155]
MENKFRHGCFACCILTIIIVAISLFASSFAVLETNRVGLRFNDIYVTLYKDKVFREGRYFMGIGNRFIAYPTTWLPMEFCSDCVDGRPIATKTRSESGSSAVSVDVEVFIYYRLRIEQLPDLYEALKENYHSMYVDKARAALANTAERFTVDDMIKRRPLVQQAFGQEVTRQLQPFYAYVAALYLGRIILRETQEKKFLDQKVSERNAAMRKVEGLVKEIEANTTADVELERVNKRLIMDTAERDANSIIAEREAAGRQDILNAEGLGYQSFQGGLNFTQEELLNYIWYLKLKEKDTTALVTGFQDDGASPLIRVS